MPRLKQHAAMPRVSAEQRDRQDFVRDLRSHIARRLSPQLHTHYNRHVRPGMPEEPQTRHDVRHAMMADPDYQLWSLMQRTSQELGWNACIDSVEQDWQALIDRAKQPQQLGSLTLNPELEIPRYNTAYDIHLMPGGYHTDQTADDIAAGAVFDLGVSIWGTGAMGPENDLLGRITSLFFKTRWPDRKPKRILDLGCTIGAPTVAWARAFPEAEVYGVDIAAPCLRYGHLRANALGVPVHFSQQNAEALDFPDGYFDVVTSHILFHETSRTAVPNILAECRRVLAPGGVSLHVDAIQADGQDLFRDFLMEWEVDNNNEHFLRTLRDMSLLEEMRKAGFPEDCVMLEWAEGEQPDPGEASYFSVPKLPVQIGLKPEDAA